MVVNGKAIPKERIVNLLLRSHGASMLEQIVVLEAAENLAVSKGLQVTQDDVDREYDMALRKLVDPLAPLASETFHRDAAERTLEGVLVERNISREEFREGMRRHAYLRAIASSETTVSEEEIQVEYQSSYGLRLQVRHIQLASPREVQRITDQLARGADFGSLARQFSANLDSAAAGGLLAPFSPEDERLPALFRQTASSLEVSQVSQMARIGEWYHLIKLEKRIEPESIPLDQVRAELEERVRERKIEEAMPKLHERLFKEADINILDPELKKAFEQSRRTNP